MSDTIKERFNTRIMRYEYDTILHEVPESGGAYVAFPWDIRAVFGKGRVKVHASFDGVPYDGSVVNMGVKNPDDSVCYIIGVTKAIRIALESFDWNVDFFRKNGFVKVTGVLADYPIGHTMYCMEKPL